MKDILKYKSIKLKYAKIKKVLKEPEVITISEGYKFDLGDKIIEVIETSGHTLGSISLLDPADKLIFSGDAVNPLMLLYLSNADKIINYIKSIRKLLTYEGYDNIWASHFEEPISKDTINDVINCAEDIINKKKGKNGKLPLIKFYKKDKILAIYKDNRII
jgi:glyoxylase-like metal-dependent hydrolase (beta-lactamase superfamily II)